MMIKIQGARENNLRNIDVDFGSGLTVVTGVSGSGKSSLVFDTLNREAQRRFQEMFTLGASRKRVSPAAVDEISGLLPAVAVGQNLLNRNPNSTVASASGLHPLIRLLYARFGTRCCPNCAAPVRILTDDALIEELGCLPKFSKILVTIVKDTKGSHTTLLSLLRSTFGLNKVIVDGSLSSTNPLEPNQPHTIEISLAELTGNEDVTTLRGIVNQTAALGSSVVHTKHGDERNTFSMAPVCGSCGTWIKRLEPTHFNRLCPDCKGEGCNNCKGTGMHPDAAATTWLGLRFDQFMHHSIDDMQLLFKPYVMPDGAARLYGEITTRLDALVRVGLGYISLDRPSPTLSRGEAQRLRLAVLLTGRLSDLLHLLDEPTIGQHPHDTENLMSAIGELSGPVIYVEHDRNAAAYANTAVDIGPGAGGQGGEIVFSGTPAKLWESSTITGKFFSGRKVCQLPERRQPPDEFMVIQGACLHNLRNIEGTLCTWEVECCLWCVWFREKHTGRGCFIHQLKNREIRWL